MRAKSGLPAMGGDFKSPLHHNVAVGLMEIYFLWTLAYKDWTSSQVSCRFTVTIFWLEYKEKSKITEALKEPENRIAYIQIKGELG